MGIASCGRSIPNSWIGEWRRSTGTHRRDNGAQVWRMVLVRLPGLSFGPITPSGWTVSLGRYNQ